jgi:hypothetical protein
MPTKTWACHPAAPNEADSTAPNEADSTAPNEAEWQAGQFR